MFKTTKIDVELEGMADLMFDRFIDQSKEERPLEQKLYLAEKNRLVIPEDNIRAFLLGDKPGGCAKIFEGRQSRKYMLMGEGHIVISPMLIPILSENKSIAFKSFDEESRWWINESAPRVKGTSSNISIKMPNKRPVLRLPWSIEFTIDLIENSLIDQNKLRNWFDQGGLMIGLCNGRPRFGRFRVSEWVVSEA